MPETTYRPGDIAMVDGKPAMRVERKLRPGVVVAAWRYVHDEWVPPLPDDAVGPVLGNVADIAAMMTKAHEAFEEPIDLDDAYTVAYVKGRNHRLDEIEALQGQIQEARREGRIGALREVDHNASADDALDIVRQMLEEEAP